MINTILNFVDTYHNTFAIIGILMSVVGFFMSAFKVELVYRLWKANKRFPTERTLNDMMPTGHVPPKRAVTWRDKLIDNILHLIISLMVFYAGVKAAGLLTIG